MALDRNAYLIVKSIPIQVDAVVDFLISSGADINAGDKYGMTSLHHCAIRGNQRALSRLLQTPGIIKEPTDVQGAT